MSDGGSGFDWGLRPGGASPEPEPRAPEPEPPTAAPEPPAAAPALPEWALPEWTTPPAPTLEPLPAPPAPEQVTQLMPVSEPLPATFDPFATAPAAPAGDAGLFGEPGSALDALFGEEQFREYETGVLDPNERPFAGRSARAAVGSPVEAAPVSRTQRVLLSIAGALVAVLALVALFFVGTRLPALLKAAPAAATSPTSSPSSGASPIGPVANGVHPWTALRGGECLDPFTSPWADTFTVVDCATPHPAQMVFRGTFTTPADQGYPGFDALQAQIPVLCAAPGIINLAAAGAYADAQVQGSYAVNDQQWAEGEHDYFCFVSRSSGQPLTASVALPHSAPATPSGTPSGTPSP